VIFSLQSKRRICLHAYWSFAFSYLLTFVRCSSLRTPVVIFLLQWKRRTCLHAYWRFGFAYLLTFATSSSLLNICQPSSTTFQHRSRRSPLWLVYIGDGDRTPENDPRMRRPNCGKWFAQGVKCRSAFFWASTAESGYDPDFPCLSFTLTF